MSTMRSFWKDVVGPSGAGTGSADAAQADDQTQSGDQAQTDSASAPGTTADVSAAPSDEDRARQSDPVVTIESTAAAVPPAAAGTVAGISAGAGAPASEGGGGGGGGVDLNTVVNIASKAWDVMKDNAPQSTNTGPVANALPKGASAMDLIWPGGDPATMVLHWHTGNLFGNTNDFDITLRWAFNGSFNGKGQYINSARVFASGSPAWGNKVSITTAFDDPENVGTADAPVANMGVLITITFTNITQSNTTNFSGFIRGNGAGKLSQA